MDSTPNTPRFDETPRLFSEGLVECPLCKEEDITPEEYVHPTIVEVNAGGSITTVDANGTKMLAGKAVGRGVRIRLGFACEQGHTFSLAFHFHKGITGIAIGGLGAVPLEIIWRD